MYRQPGLGEVRSKKVSEHYQQYHSLIDVFLLDPTVTTFLIRPPCIADAANIFCSCGYFLLSSFFSSPILSGCKVDVYNTSTHDVALVQI